MGRESIGLTYTLMAFCDNCSLLIMSFRLAQTSLGVVKARHHAKNVTKFAIIKTQLVNYMQAQDMTGMHTNVRFRAGIF